MKKFIVSFVTLTCVLLSCAFADQTVQLPFSSFRNVVIFGDSLTDAGNVTVANPIPCVKISAPVTNHSGGSYPLTVWAGMGARNTFYAVPSSRGGNDFALSGATIAPGVYNFQTGQLTPNSNNIYTTEYNSFSRVAGQYQPLSSNLYVIWGGADDLLDAVENLAAKTGGKPSVAQVTSTLTGALKAGQAYLMQTIFNLYQHLGARNFLIIGMPNLGDTPLASAADTPANNEYLLGEFAPLKAALTTVSTDWNNSLHTFLEHVAAMPGVRVYYFNPTPILNAVIANPAAYGFTHTNQAVWCVAQRSNPTANPDDYVFFNYIHPTTHTHNILFQQLLNGVTLIN